MSGVLARIVERKKAEVARLDASEMPARVPAGPRGTVVERLRRHAGSPLRLIAEIKKRSPSAGALSTKLAPDARALAYAHSGATMISVLTDAEFFGGSWEDLVAVRHAIDRTSHATPLLAKEFVIDERQLVLAAACGADAALLIARILDRARVAELASAARDLKLEPLVEVVSEDEVEWALAAGARVIGVNARDLDTLGMDAERAGRVVAAIPDDRVAVHLSGLKTPADVRAIAATRADAALIGEALMREDDPSSLLASFVQAAAEPR